MCDEVIKSFSFHFTIYINDFSGAGAQPNGQIIDSSEGRRRATKSLPNMVLTTIVPAQETSITPPSSFEPLKMNIIPKKPSRSVHIRPWTTVVRRLSF